MKQHYSAAYSSFFTGRRLKHCLTVFACLFAIASSVLGQDKCVQTKYGECFRIHARYAVYTGDGMEVLWPVGTHRLLWAAYGTDPLDTLLNGHLDNSYIFGDFLVCPLSKEIPGEMRHVCIKQMEHLKMTKRPEENQ